MYMMFSMLMTMLLLILIGMTILFINKLLSMKTFKDREKMKPFECGFDQLTSPQLPFSIQFFLITLMFLIFDMEIILILPIINSLNNQQKSTILIFMMFLIILFTSLWYEWTYNYLTWI